MFIQISGHITIFNLLIPNLIKNFIKKYCVFLRIFKDGWTTDGPADQQTREIILSTPRGIPKV